MSDVFNYEHHTDRDVAELLDFVRSLGYAVVGPLKCRMKQSAQETVQDHFAEHARREVAAQRMNDRNAEVA